MSQASITPRLIVHSAAQAIDFYEQAFEATLSEHFVDDRLGKGFVVHARLQFGDAVFTLADENPGFQNKGARQLGGTPVILEVTVDDVDALAARFQEHGGEVVFPLGDQFYGRREGRFRDPFGHLWILSQRLEEVSDDEVRRRMAAMNFG